VYKDLEPVKSVEGASWVGRTEAEREIEQSRKRAIDNGYNIVNVPGIGAHTAHPPAE
jgi:hypothetical protein